MDESSELLAFTLAREMHRLSAQAENMRNDECPDRVLTKQFVNDFERIAFKLTDLDWHKPPRPHNIDGCKAFRTTEIARRLDIAPLLRMARLIGLARLRYLFLVGSPKSQEEYRLELRARLRHEYPDQRKGKKKSEQELELILFGNTVLAYEARGETRTRALEKAKKELRLDIDTRSTQRRFKAFNEIVKRTGYVPNSLDWAIPYSQPQFRRTALIPRKGAPKK